MDHVDHEISAGDGVDTDTVSIECRREGTRAVVVLAGELDLGGGDAVEEAVAALAADGVDDVQVEARGLTFMDSSGLGGVLAARAIVVEAGGEFRFGPTTATVARVIDLAGVGNLLGPTPA